jgi:nitroimidazol reductase NimA-like FMN-containing flavoprotein (pyridoxamine 5'-phosphate oxidase superfamily)
VTRLDGLVLARSTFHSSMNYRSVVIFGRGEKIVDSADKVKALDLLVDHLAPGRALEVRPTTEPELEATAVIRVPIVEASAKIRTGPPGDAKADLDLPIWAGVVPIVLEIGQPVAAPGSEELEVPPSVRSFRWS